MHRRAFTLIEVLVAAAFVAVVAVSIQELMATTLRGVSIDRVSEMKRKLAHDLLERFATPYSDVGSLFPAATKGLGAAQVSLDDACTYVGMPRAEGEKIKAILRSGGVTGFSLIWKRSVSVGKGAGPATLRLDVLFCKPLQTDGQRTPDLRSFRVFAVRGGA